MQCTSRVSFSLAQNSGTEFECVVAKTNLAYSYSCKLQQKVFCNFWPGSQARLALAPSNKIMELYFCSRQDLDSPNNCLQTLSFQNIYKLKDLSLVNCDTIPH